MFHRFPSENNLSRKKPLLVLFEDTARQETGIAGALPVVPVRVCEGSTNYIFEEDNMPGARTHDMITVVTAAAADVAYFALAPHPDGAIAALFTIAYLFAGFACAGDLDLNSKEYRRWGPLRFLWMPYRVCVPHRSWVSHGMILGGVIRAFYLAIVTTLLVWTVVWGISRLGPHLDPNAVARNEWASLFGFMKTHPQWTVAMLMGFILAGSAHSAADFMSTWFKRRF